MFESSLARLVDAALGDGAAGHLVRRTVDRVREPGWSNSLSAKLLQLAGPGVPDVYQGSELWETSLVDPDNRRDVDFTERRRLLADLDDGWLPPVDETGAAKLLVTSRVLRARRDHPEWFSRYLPVSGFGPAASHLVAFDRGGAIAIATRLPIGLAREGGWKGTTLLTTGEPLIDLITGARHRQRELAVADVLSRYPVALLARVDEGDDR